MFPIVKSFNVAYEKFKSIDVLLEMKYPIDGLMAIPLIPDSNPSDEPNRGRAETVNLRSFFFDCPNPLQKVNVRIIDNRKIFFIWFLFRIKNQNVINNCSTVAEIGRDVSAMSICVGW